MTHDMMRDFPGVWCGGGCRKLRCCCLQPLAAICLDGRSVYALRSVLVFCETVCFVGFVLGW